MCNLNITEYRNIRVLTTQQIAEAYGTDSKIISNNFNRNKHRYVEGKHYISLMGAEKREFLNHHQFDDSSKNATVIYLWTEKGAFLHAKSLNTDIAWEVYDQLVDNYFKKQDMSDSLSPELRAIIVVDKRITKVEKKVEHLEYDIPLYGAEADELCNHVKRKGVEMLGGKQSNSYKDGKVRTAVYTDIYNQIKREFGLFDDKGRYKSYKALKRRYIYEAHELVDSYELPTYLAEHVADCNAQMNMEVA